MSHPESEDDRTLHSLTVTAPRMYLYTADGRTLSLENWYRGRHGFMVCGGPSLAALPLSELARPGVVTMGLNNSWALWRPNLWCSVDNPGNFLDVCWKDPSIIKFVPIGKLHTRLVVRHDNGSFRASRFTVAQMPSVFYFRRNNRFDPESFLTEGSVNWGTGVRMTDSLGDTGGRSVMLAALRLMAYLGFAHIYIVGADFHMEAGREYAWDQRKSATGLTSNNRTYAVLNKRFGALAPRLEAMGCHVYNCTPGGLLEAFPRLEFATAVERATEEASKPVGLAGWYTHRVREQRVCR